MGNGILGIPDEDPVVVRTKATDTFDSLSATETDGVEATSPARVGDHAEHLLQQSTTSSKPTGTVEDLLKG